ncbi:hypothetical protein [Plantactinospora soyae]|uniref:Uncharacterized protein n=1 Tax=Plantactinospora soyae TaxID=1544732 RepID=A0A927MDV5_9ACTN|nr:hypothetical protein [Plantactinospora soyae]MBE1491855.1 hypothetical protein [Plantactinospora soyae]
MVTVDLALLGSELLAAEESQATPMITLVLPLLAVVLSPLTAWLTFQFVRKRELAESVRVEVERMQQVTLPSLAATTRHEVERDTEVARQAEERSRREAVRREALKWTTPILMAADELNSRLGNVLEGGAYPALEPGWRRPDSWSMSHDYLRSSTLYLFSAYFSYVQLLRRSLNFELFRSQEEKDALFGGIEAVASALATYPTPWSSAGRDAQVFRLQQRALGELLFVDGVEGPTCMTYADFTGRMTEDRFVQQLAPLRELLDGLMPVQEDCRWRRLVETRNELYALSKVCRGLLAGVAD